VPAATVAIAVAVLLAVLVLDVRGWSEAVDRGDRSYAPSRAASWQADPRLPGDPAGALLGVDRPLRVRRAIAAFVVADRARRGFDNGARRTELRSAAAALLTDVASGGQPAEAAQADVLLGVLAAAGQRAASGETPDERSRNLFEAAVRLDPRSTDAKFDLELVVRRMRAVGSRNGAGEGSGPRGGGRRGAGSGTPGRGY
jgi:hypothetical protein